MAVRLRNQLALALARLALWASARLPLSVARRIGRSLGAWYYRLDKRGRRVAERNIALAYPERGLEWRERLVKQSLEETGALAAEMGHVWYRPWSHTASLITEVQGADTLRQALAEGRGVIVLGPHLGNWEVLGLHLATLGDMVALFEPPSVPELGQLVQSARERSGGRLVPTTPRGIAALVKSVRAGGISGILPDQVPDSPAGGLNVPFMGVTCATAALGCNLIQRSKAVAFMGAALRVPEGFILRYVPAPEALYSDDLPTALTAMNDAVADLLKGWDAQYQWQYKRFRCRPDGPEDHYRDLMAPRPDSSNAI